MGMAQFSGVGPFDELDAGDGDGFDSDLRCMSAAVIPARKRSRRFSGRADQNVEDAAIERAMEAR
jgi:hypothetical protein